MFTRYSSSVTFLPHSATAHGELGGDSATHVEQAVGVFFRDVVGRPEHIALPRVVHAEIERIAHLAQRQSEIDAAGQLRLGRPAGDCPSFSKALAVSAVDRELVGAGRQYEPASDSRNRSVAANRNSASTPLISALAALSVMLHKQAALV